MLFRNLLFTAVATLLLAAAPTRSEPGRVHHLRRLEQQKADVMVEPRRLSGKSSKGPKKSKCSKAAKSKQAKSSKGGCSVGGFCTCSSCTQEVLDTRVGSFTCGERIEHLLNQYARAFPRTTAACKRVAGLEFPEGKIWGHLAELLIPRYPDGFIPLSLFQNADCAIPSPATAGPLQQ